MRRLALLVALALAGMAALAAPAGATVLTLHCKYSHTRQADPIVLPGGFPSAHVHDFLGSDATDELSSADSLLGTSTTCKTLGDTAAYWYPAPLWNGAPTRTTSLGEYWTRPAGTLVAPPPHGMTYVAGNSHAMSAADNSALKWNCGNGGGQATPPDCIGSKGGSMSLTAVLSFPICWDGASAFDTQAGLAPAHFSDPASCPAGTTRIARLVSHTHFLDPRTGKAMVNPYNADGSLGLSFASGAYYTYHGDFLNAYDQDILRGLIVGCLDGMGSCPPHA